MMSTLKDPVLIRHLHNLIYYLSIVHIHSHIVKKKNKIPLTENRTYRSPPGGSSLCIHIIYRTLRADQTLNMLWPIPTKKKIT